LIDAVLLVRINEPRSREAEADLAVAREIGIDGVIIPKVEQVADLAVDAAGGSGPVLPLIAIIETARGVANVETIAGATEAQLAAFAFGAEDFITDLRGRRTDEGLEVLYARSRVVLAARLAGVQALDQVFVNIRDEDAFRRDAEIGRNLGYDGKMCIVPRQIDIANAVFSPSAEELDRCRRLIEAYTKAQEEGRGAIEFEGGMVDEPLLKRARHILQLPSLFHGPE
jgi:citrate lyase subunit beta/citryl-CoA lyase